jgi:hypothetical protein
MFQRRATAFALTDTDAARAKLRTILLVFAIALGITVASALSILLHVS